MADDADPADEPARLNIETTCLKADLPPAVMRDVVGKLADAARLQGLADGSISLAIVDDARMVELNAAHRSGRYVTDVLSFDLRDRPNGTLDGELIINADEAARQAEARDHALVHELLLYALHGLLHLAGYDDADAQQAAAMHRREDELLEAVGVGAVFHRTRSNRRQSGEAGQTP